MSSEILGSDMEYANPAEDEAAIRAVVQRLLDTVENRDTATMYDILMSEGCATQVRDGVMTQTRLGDMPAMIANGAFRRTENLKEQFYNAVVRIDQNIAVVWAHYDFFIAGAVHHWGTNIISLVKDDGVWRIASITDNGWSGPRPEDWDSRF